MKIRFFNKWICLVMAILAGLLFAGCSPTTNTWVDRGIKGVDNSKAAMKDWYDTASKAEDSKLKNLITASFADIKSCRDGKLIDPQTGLIINLSDKWLDEHQAGLEVGLNFWRNERQALFDKYTNDVQNLNSTAECFKQIRRLNVAWADSQKVMLSEVERLATKIDELKAAQQAAAAESSSAE